MKNGDSGGAGSYLNQPMTSPSNDELASLRCFSWAVEMNCETASNF